MPFSCRKTVCYIKESSSRTPSKTILAEKALHFANSYTSSILKILQHVERTFYTNKSWHFKYSVSSMIKLFVVKCFRKLSYDKIISSLTEEEAILPSCLKTRVFFNFLWFFPNFKRTRSYAVELRINMF